jgi:hypothetical protein
MSTVRNKFICDENKGELTRIVRETDELLEAHFQFCRLRLSKGNIGQSRPNGCLADAAIAGESEC